MALQCCFCRFTGSLVNGYIKQICSCIKWTLRSAVKARKLKPLCSNTTWWRRIWSLSESPRTVYFDIRWKGVCPNRKSPLCEINRRLSRPQSSFGRGRGKKTPPSSAGIQTLASYTLKSQRTCVINIGIPNCVTCIHMSSFVFSSSIFSSDYWAFFTELKKKKSGVCRGHVSPPGCAPKPLDRFP